MTLTFRHFTPQITERSKYIPLNKQVDPYIPGFRECVGDLTRHALIGMTLIRHFTPQIAERSKYIPF